MINHLTASCLLTDQPQPLITDCWTQVNRVLKYLKAAAEHYKAVQSTSEQRQSNTKQCQSTTELFRAVDEPAQGFLVQWQSSKEQCHSTTEQFRVVPEQSRSTTE